MTEPQREVDFAKQKTEGERVWISYLLRSHQAGELAQQDISISNKIKTARMLPQSLCDSSLPEGAKPSLPPGGRWILQSKRQKESACGYPIYSVPLKLCDKKERSIWLALLPVKFNSYQRPDNLINVNTHVSEVSLYIVVCKSYYFQIIPLKDFCTELITAFTFFSVMLRSIYLNN